MPNEPTYVLYRYGFDYQALAKSLADFLVENQMLPSELDEMLGKKNLVMPILRVPSPYGDDCHIRLGTLFDICNTCEMNPHDFITMEKASNMTSDGKVRK